MQVMSKIISLFKALLTGLSLILLGVFVTKAIPLNELRSFFPLIFIAYAVGFSLLAIEFISWIKIRDRN